MTEALSILVIDDNEDDRLLYRRTLQKSTYASYKLYEAEQGDEGIDAIREQAPSCVLLDYSLPGRNGVEVLKRIRSKYPYLPVVMLTGQGNETVAVTAMREGAQNYIAKGSITTETLEHAILVAMKYCAMQSRIEEQRNSLEIFARAMAHDLKGQLRIVHSFLGLLGKREKLTDKGGEYLTNIRRAANYMSTLIETVYFYTRLDTTEAVTKESCDVSDLLQDVKERLAPIISERGAVISSSPLPRLDANREQLTQVIQNLLSNAISYCDTRPEIHISAVDMTDHWLFRIRDNGRGIDPLHADSVFQPFKRIAKENERGVGLGLATCKKIVESHGGKIWYEPSATRGVMFQFTLPKTEVQSLEEQSPLEVPALEIIRPVNPRKRPVPSSMANVLLVDDSETDLELARIMLFEHPRMHCNLHAARDGQEAFDMLIRASRKGRMYDLVLLDINMPRMDGFELMERMRQLNLMERVKVVVCSTSNDESDIKRAQALGATGYLVKPTRFDALRQIIDRHTDLQLKQEQESQILFRAA